MKLAHLFPTILTAVVPALLLHAQAQNREPQAASIQGNVLRPAQATPGNALLAQIRLPAGFAISRFAENLGKPRMIAVAANGDIYVSDRDKGSIMLLRDSTGSGKADVVREVARKPDAHGLAISGNRLYVAAIRELHVATIAADGSLGEFTTLYDDLPDAGQHPNRTLDFGPDGKLYLSIGSTCNACDEPNPENATLVQINPDGSGRRIVARGLRNTIGFDWHPTSGALFGFDHGTDWLGDEQPREELNRIVDGAHYGWPWVFEDRKLNRTIEPPAGMTFEQFAATTTSPEALYTAHAAPMQMLFYTGMQFPQEYRNDAFVAMRGSWNRAQPSGYRVVRVRFDAQGRPNAVEDFAGTWLSADNQAHFGRLAGLAQHADGSLLLTDDTNGVMYRIAYTGR